jgi:hypothetical protein
MPHMTSLIEERQNVPQLTTFEAREITDQIKVHSAAMWDLVVKAYCGRADIALGYENWDTFCTKEFRDCRVPIPREERPEMVRSLRLHGLSLRAIGSVTGLSKDTVARDLASAVGNETADVAARDEEPEINDNEVAPVIPLPSRITGLDDKNHPSAKPTSANVFPVKGHANSRRQIKAMKYALTSLGGIVTGLETVFNGGFERSYDKAMAAEAAATMGDYISRLTRIRRRLSTYGIDGGDD